MQSNYSTFMTKCHVKTAIVGYGVSWEAVVQVLCKQGTSIPTNSNKYRDDGSRGGSRTKYLDPPWAQRWSSHVALSSRPGPICSFQYHILAFHIGSSATPEHIQWALLNKQISRLRINDSTTKPWPARRSWCIMYGSESIRLQCRQVKPLTHSH